MLVCPNCAFGNADGARFCSNCGTALEVDRPIAGERRFATVLFADVARSTAIAERLDPEDWAQIMNGGFAFMNAAVSRYGGTVSRLMGDAVLALFGAPVAHEDDAERAVRAGLEIQEAGMAYAQSVKQRYGVDFDLRVGINTGTAVLALVGDAVKSEYTALGDAANVAARLQAAAAPGTVLISADTQRLVRALFDFRPRGQIELKGKETAVDTYEVLGAKAVPGRTRGLEGIESPLVGRDREIAILRERFADLGVGRGSVVMILGEAGLGKSRLVAELRNLHDNWEGTRAAWLESRAISYGMSIPYYPWRSLGRQMIGATEMDAAPAVREKLASFVQRLGLRTSDIPFYETILAVDSEQSRIALANLPGDAVVNSAAAAVVNAIKTALRTSAGAQPHVLVMDDLHWSDSATLELTAQVATLAAFEPLMLVCVLRPDRKAPSWQLVDRLQASLGSSFTRIDLEPLDPSASGELLGNLLRIEDLPDSIRAQILERSEGNPFYLEEVLRALIDGGQVVREGEHWRATKEILDVNIPDTLAGVLSARIDRLPEMTKRVAQTAAVIGRVFLHRVLETVCREAPVPERIDHVEPHIATLSYEQLVREKARDPEREYIFKHALTCEAAYELLLKSRRRDLHARAGQALERLFADRRDEFAAMLAHHFDEAEDTERALLYSRIAAGNARKLFALREELELRERILELHTRRRGAEATVIDDIFEWATARHLANNYAGVVEKLEEAIALARSIGDRRRLASALSWSATIYMVTGFPSRGAPHLTEAQALATELGDERLLLLPLFVATFGIVDRDPAEGAARLREVIDLARTHKVPEVESHAMGYLAIALARLGDFEAARRQIDEALESAPHAGSPVKEADVHIAVAEAYRVMSEIDKAFEHGTIGARLSLKAGGLECACAGFYQVGQAQLELQQPDDALNEFRRSLEYGEQAGFYGYLNVIRGGAAMAEFRKGIEDAVERLRAAVQGARAIEDDYAVATMSEQLAEALMQLGRLDEAAPLLDEAVAHYRDRNMRPYLSHALDLRGRLLERLGRGEESHEANEEAAAIRAGIVGYREKRQTEAHGAST